MIRFCIVGCGTISAWHAKAIEKAEGGTLVGVVDVRRESAEAFAKERGVKAYESLEDMLADKSVDAVCICTPSGFHFDTAKKAIAAGKHVLVEKPLAMTTEECDELVALAKEKKVCAGVISQYRFSPAIQELKKIVSEGRLGKIVTADLIMNYFRSQEYYDSSSWRGTWKLDGGSLMNQGIHGVDALLYIMGNAKSVYGYARTLAHKMEAEDTANATVEFENGTLGLVQSSTAIYPGSPRNIVLAGTKGTVSVKDDIIVECDIEGGYTIPANCLAPEKKNEGFQDPTGISTAGHEYQLQNFIDAIREGKEPAVPLSEGRRTVAFINAVYQSSREERPIQL